MRTETECKAVGPVRYLWGNKTNLICMLPKHHTGPHNDPSLTGYSTFWPNTGLKLNEKEHKC